MDKDKGFTQIPNKILEALYEQRLSPLHYQVLLYVIRKTYGYKGKIWDTIAISKMARDIHRRRCKVSVAVGDLEKMNIIEVVRTASRKGHEMRIKDPSEWEKSVTKTEHVTKSERVTKTEHEALRNRNANRYENGTHNINKYTLQNKPPKPPMDESDDFVEDFEAFYNEEDDDAW